MVILRGEIIMNPLHACIHSFSGNFVFQTIKNYVIQLLIIYPSFSFLIVGDRNPHALSSHKKMFIETATYANFNLGNFQKYYTAPLNIPLTISGNFGDIRDNSFHFGIDFRTNEEEGYPVFSVADGYVSRIKIEPGGYGKAIYINHPNGMTSVYGHLSTFYDVVAKFAKNLQYMNKSFKLDTVLRENQFKVKQNDTIGFSGNRGFSSGPHLHFELRNTKDQNPVNPFIYDFHTEDTTCPIIDRLWVYTATNYIPENNQFKRSYDVSGNYGFFKLSKDSVILLSKNSGLGIEAFDFMTDTFRRHSVYIQKLFVDTSLWFETIFDEISFEQTGYVNSIIDYEEKNTSYSNIYKLYSWPNQNLMFNKIEKHNGLINFQDTFIHKLKIVLSDANGNVSTLSFLAKIKNKPDNVISKLSKHLINWEKENVFTNKSIKVVLPKNSLYTNIEFSLKQMDHVKLPVVAKSNAFSIGNSNIPLKNPIYLSFPVNGIASKYITKLVIALLDKRNNLISIGGKITDRFLTAPSKTFGTFVMCLDVDTPFIKPLNISENKDMSSEDSIKFEIKDKLSGIQNYAGTIDQKWVLFEYDAKNNFLYYKFDPERFVINNKNHLLILEVTDKRNNKSVLKINFKK